MAKVSERPIYEGDPSSGYVVMDIPTVNGNRIRRVAPNKVGAQGPAGPQGPAGSTGPQGDAGPQGVQGPAGSDGLDGADGADAVPGGSSTQVQFHDGGAPAVLGGDSAFTWDKTNDELYVNGNVRLGVKTVGYAANVALDFQDGALQSVSLTGDLALTSSNLATGRGIALRIVADGSIRNLSFPATWTFLGTKPTNIAANKTGVLSLTSYGTTDADVVAAWGVEA